jgi:hypothetical protein
LDATAKARIVELTLRGETYGICPHCQAVVEDDSDDDHVVIPVRQRSILRIKRGTDV